MKAFHDAGVRTTCFISPIFPGLTDLPSIIHRAKNQCNLVWLENLNLRGGYKKTIFDYITEKHPDLLPLYDTIYNKKERSYWSMLDAQMRQFCQEEGLLYVRDDDSIKRPFNDPPIVVNYFFNEEIIPRPKCRRTGNQNYIVTCRKLEVVEVEAFFIFTFTSYLTHRRTNTFALIFNDLYFYYKSIVILHFGFIILIIPEE